MSVSPRQLSSIPKFTYRQRQQRDILISGINEVDDLDGGFPGSRWRLISVEAVPYYLAHSRISFLGVDQICDFEVQGQVRLVVLGIACISCARPNISQRLPDAL